MKVAGKSKQIDLMLNTDCRDNLYHVIDIGCIFNKSAIFSINARAQMYHFKSYNRLTFVRRLSGKF